MYGNTFILLKCSYSVVALWIYSQLIVCKCENSHTTVCCISSSRNWWWTQEATTYSQMESIVDMTLYLLLYTHSDGFSPQSIERALSFGDLHYSGKVKAHKVAVVNSYNPDVFTNSWNISILVHVSTCWGSWLLSVESGRRFARCRTGESDCV